jgi:hypothetical protein
MNNFENGASPLEKLHAKREQQREEVEGWVLSYLPTLGEHLTASITPTEMGNVYGYVSAIRVEVRDSITQEIRAISIFENGLLDEWGDELQRKTNVLDILKNNYDAQSGSRRRDETIAQSKR